MTATKTLAAVTMFLVVGTAFGQAPTDHQPPANGLTLVPGGDVGTPGCPMPGCGPCEVSGGRFWGSAEYLLGWTNGDPLPPLVTTSPPGTPQAQAGVIGPGTSTLFGGTPANTHPRSGARAELGYWFVPDEQFGIEAGFMFLAGGSDTFAAGSNGTPILARPYIDLLTGNSASSIVAFPGFSTGSVGVNDSARILYSYNLDLREKIFAGAHFRLDALLGYRYLRYDERLTIQQEDFPLTGPFTPGTSVIATDSFGTRNIFNGADLGFRGEVYYGNLSLELLAKCAAGNLSRTVNIAGSQQVNVPGAASVTNIGGLLALASNIGQYNTHSWTGVPELGVTICYNLTESIRLRAGYSVLWTNVVRPGDQIDPFINSSILPPANQTPGTPSRPTFTGLEAVLAVQAVTFGLEFRY